MYGSKKRMQPPVIETQNPHLRQFEAVVRDRQALAALRDSNDLSKAFEISRPSSTVFEESLLASKRELQRAKGMVSTGYDGSNELLRIAGTVAELADTLYDEMDRKRTKDRKPRITESD